MKRETVGQRIRRLTAQAVALGEEVAAVKPLAEFDPRLFAGGRDPANFPPERCVGVKSVLRAVYPSPRVVKVECIGPRAIATAKRRLAHRVQRLAGLLGEIQTLQALVEREPEAQYRRVSQIFEP